MKRTMLFTLAILLITITSAYAGIGDWFQELSMKVIAGAAITGLFAVASFIWGGAKIMSYKRIANEGKDCAIWLYEATRASSDGGRKITQQELEDGLKEFGELGAQVLALIAESRKKK